MLQKQPGNVCILFAENISSMSIKLELGKKLQYTATLIYSTPNTTVAYSEKRVICSFLARPTTWHVLQETKNMHEEVIQSKAATPMYFQHYFKV